MTPQEAELKFYNEELRPLMDKLIVGILPSDVDTSKLLVRVKLDPKVVEEIKQLENDWVSKYEMSEEAKKVEKESGLAFAEYLARVYNSQLDCMNKR